MSTLSRILDLKEKIGLSDADFEKELGLKSKTVDSWKRGNSSNFIKIIVEIADYFNVTTDYLLRGDSPVHQSITTGDVHSNSGIIGHSNAPVTIKNGVERELTKQEQDLLRIYNSVNTKKQLQLMNFALELEEQ